jgi:hypothetical protein
VYCMSTLEHVADAEPRALGDRSMCSARPVNSTCTRRAMELLREPLQGALASRHAAWLGRAYLAVRGRRPRSSRRCRSRRPALPRMLASAGHAHGRGSSRATPIVRSAGRSGPS